MKSHCWSRSIGILISTAVLIFTSSCRQGSEQPAAGGGSQEGEIAPEIGAVTPASGTGRTATLRLSASHPAGAAAIANIQVLIDEKMTATGSGGCWIEINASKFVAVRNEESTGFLPAVAIGSPGIAADSKCSVPAAGVKLEPKDTEVVVTLPITFAPTFKGPKKIFVIASTARKNCPWTERGAWTVD